MVKTKLKLKGVYFCLLLYLGMKSGLSCWRRNIGWRRLRIGFGGRYLGPRGTSKQQHRRRLLNEELHDLYCLPNITLLINVEEWVCRGIRHVWGRGQVHTRFLWGNLREATLTLNIPSLGRQRCLQSWGPRRPSWFFCNLSTVWCGRLLKLCFLGFWNYNSVIQALLVSNILCLFISTEVSE